MASRRGGASAPQACKSALKSCLRSGPALSPKVSRDCFKHFNACRTSGPKSSGRRGKRRGRR
jgi:hypothetical protein